MRLLPIAALPAALLMLAGCGKPQPTAELIAGWHFAGTAQLRGDTNGLYLRKVLAEPTTARIVASALAKLAHAPQLILPAAPAAAGSSVAPLLGPMIEEVLHAESIGEVREGEWAVAARLGAAGVAQFQTAWGSVMAGVGAPATKAGAAFEASWPDNAGQARLTSVGDWVVVGAGKAPLVVQRSLVERVKTTRPGVPGGAWLVADLNLPKLAPTLGLPANTTWPNVALQLAGKGVNIRTQARLRYDRPLDLKLEEWRVPTNSIREPLVAFTAVRGLERWLARQPAFQALEAGAAPNQIFGWAQSQVSLQVYLSWACANPVDLLRRVLAHGGSVAVKEMPQLNLAGLVSRIAYQTNYNRVAWEGLPLLVPYVAVATNDPGFVVVGIFPTENTRPPAPPQLYSQIMGRTNLVFYDWEITANRAQSWQQLRVFHNMIANYPPAPTNNPAVLWLQDPNVERYLGNAVTEIIAQTPRELVLTRTSATGFTGYELNQLVSWLDDPAFPYRTIPKSVLQERREKALHLKSAGPAGTNTPAP